MHHHYTRRQHQRHASPEGSVTLMWRSRHGEEIIITSMRRDQRMGKGSKSRNQTDGTISKRHHGEKELHRRYRTTTCIAGTDWEPRVQRTIQDQGHAKQGCRNATLAEASWGASLIMVWRCKPRTTAATTLTVKAGSVQLQRS